MLLDPRAVLRIEGFGFHQHVRWAIAQADIVKDGAHAEIGQLDLRETELFAERDGQNGHVRCVVRRVRFSAFDCRYSEECVVVFQTDVHQSLNRPGDLLDQERSLCGGNLLFRDQASIKDDEFRVGKERIAAAFQRDFGAAFLSSAQRFVETERQVGAFDRCLEFVKLPLRRVHQRIEHSAHGYGIHRRLDGEASDATLFEKLEDLTSELVFVARQPELASVDEERLVLRLERETALFRYESVRHVHHCGDWSLQRLVVDCMNLRGAEEVKPRLPDDVLCSGLSRLLRAGMQRQVVDSELLRRLLRRRLRAVGFVAHRLSGTGMLLIVGIRRAIAASLTSPRVRVSSTLRATSAGLPPAEAISCTRWYPAGPVDPRPRRASSRISWSFADHSHRFDGIHSSKRGATALPPICPRSRTYFSRSHSGRSAKRGSVTSVSSRGASSGHFTVDMARKA